VPNLFTGGYNYHGKHEFVTLEGMEKGGEGDSADS
jgi:tripeptide aminopeptidase